MGTVVAAVIGRNRPPARGGEILEQLDAGTAAHAQGRDAQMSARDSVEALLLGAPVLAHAGDVEAEALVEAQARGGVARGDGRVVDAEKERFPRGLVPARQALVGRKP